MTKKNPILLGAHMSISGGKHRAFERGESIGCTAIQLFTKNNRQWKAKPLNQEEIELFKTTAKQSSIQSLVAHATYLINIGSPNKIIEKKSVDAVIIELKRCNALGIPYLVLHPGSHLNTDEESCIKRIATNLNKILKATPGKTMLLLETMAGQGSTVCHTFETIAHIIKQSKYKHRLGVCFDTCHAFVAGYDFRTQKTYDAMWKEFDHIIGLNKLKVIHINDSKRELGSKVDRHAEIGKGKLGLQAFRLLCNDKRFFNIPKILETPMKELDDHLKNMKIIYSLLSPETRKKLEIKKLRVK